MTIVVSIITIWTDHVTGVSRVASDDLDVVKCKKLLDEGRFNQNFYNNIGAYQDLVESSGICFDFKEQNMTIQGSFLDNNSRYLSIMFGPCSLNDSTQCANVSEIGDLYAHVIHLSQSIDLTNKKDPISYFSDPTDYMSINPGTF